MLLSRLHHPWEINIKNESSNDDDDNDDSSGSSIDDDIMALFVSKFGKMMKNKGYGIRR